MESTIPVFWNVERIPDVAPRWRAGTLFMMPVTFGAANSPVPIPLRKISTANAGKEKFAGRVISARKVKAAKVIPPAVNHFAP